MCLLHWNPDSRFSRCPLETRFPGRHQNPEVLLRYQPQLRDQTEQTGHAMFTGSGLPEGMSCQASQVW